MESSLRSSVGDKLNEQSYYDARWSKQFDQPISGAKLVRTAAILREISELKLERPRILEIGSGTGSLAAILAQIGSVTAVELSPKAVEFARAKYPYIDFLAGSFFDVELPRDHFDLVVSQEVIEHVDDQSGMLNRIQTVLKPSGVVILTTPNASVADRNGFLRKQKSEGGAQPKENLLTVSELKRLVQTRFTVIKTYTIILSGHDGIYRFINHSKLRKRGRWRRMMEALGCGLHTVIVARVKR